MSERERKILDTAENGIAVVDSELNVVFWNRWLAVNTQISKEQAEGTKLADLFPSESFSILRRKIKIALKLGSSTYANSSIDKYLVPIKLEKVTSSRFSHMRQDVVITPISENEVSIILYDTTPLLEAKAIIDEQLQIVKKQATTDALTGCYNRKHFHEILLAETARSQRHALFFSLIILDIDNFKSVNDTYGHLTGDEVLKAIAQKGLASVRRSDIFARWGGEEFIILLPETGLAGAIVVAEKVRSSIAAFNTGVAGCRTCSFGVAQFDPKQADEVNAIIYNADKALYFAKNQGKNMVAICREGDIGKALVDLAR